MRYLLIPIACLASIIGLVSWWPKLCGIVKWRNRQDRDSMQHVWGYFVPEMDPEWRRVYDNPWSLHDWKNINSERVKSDAESGVKVISFVCFMLGAIIISIVWALALYL